ncbi:MAG: DNA polymerase III subunit psi [Legionella sp.]|nr:DNA polymerase III subunit psi [Legionella sp.]
MYSNTTLYYLNQLGIRPWIKRTSLLFKEDNQAQQEYFKLLVFISSTLSAKAKSLLQQMMTCINLEQHELSIIPVEERDFSSQNSAQWHNQTPAAILVLGLNESPLLQEVHFSCPVLSSIDPDHLINHPADKKIIFKDLNTINQLLS